MTHEFCSIVITSDKGGGTCFCPCLFVCLSVCLCVSKITQNVCINLDEMLRVDRCRDMDELIYLWARSGSYLDTRTGQLSPISHRLRNFAALPKAASELRCYVAFYIRKTPRIRLGGGPLQRAVVLKWFYSLSRRKTFVGNKCTLPSALLVFLYNIRRQWKSKYNNI